MADGGPPPVSKAFIDDLQVVEVSQEQVDEAVACSVCCEHFALEELVRQLPCLHIYHEHCIRQWLELHGTCPICRQKFGEAEGYNSQENYGLVIYYQLSRRSVVGGPSVPSDHSGPSDMEFTPPSQPSSASIPTDPSPTPLNLSQASPSPVTPSYTPPEHLNPDYLDLNYTLSSPLDLNCSPTSPPDLNCSSPSSPEMSYSPPSPPDPN